MWLDRWHLLTALLALAAAMAMVEVDSDMWKVEESGVYNADTKELFTFVTNHKDVKEWFPWFRRFREESSSAAVGIGKKYNADVVLPGFTYSMEFVVTSFVPGRRVQLKAEASWLRPVVVVSVASESNANARTKADGGKTKARAKVVFAVKYDRRSMLFQMTVAPVLSFVTSHNLRHSLFVIRWLLPPKE